MTRDVPDTLHEASEQKTMFPTGRVFSMLEMMGATLTCDFCGRWQRIPALDPASTYEKAAGVGWTRAGTKDKCRICSQASPPKNKKRKTSSSNAT